MPKRLLTDDEIDGLVPKKKTPWGLIFILAFGAIVGGTAVYFALGIQPRGMSMTGDGHIVVTEKAGTWLLMTEGTLVRATPQSAALHELKTGPCSKIEGSLDGNQLDVEHVECIPGEPLKPLIGTRMQRMGLKFGYWAESIERKGDDVEPHLATPEIMAAMVDPRFQDPQMLTMYTPLFPETLREARAQGLPPPVIIQVKRNDFFIRRVTRTELAEFLARDRFVISAGAPKGGWLVREVQIGTSELPPLERLLTAPEEAPWPTTLLSNPVIVSRRTPPPGPGEPPPK